jgi:hypothetical protein
MMMQRRISRRDMAHVYFRNEPWRFSFVARPAVAVAAAWRPAILGVPANESGFPVIEPTAAQPY